MKSLDITKHLSIVNTNHKIKIRVQKNLDHSALYLDNNNRKERIREYLKLKLYLTPKSYNDDMFNIRVAEEIRRLRELEIIERATGLKQYERKIKLDTFTPTTTQFKAKKNRDLYELGVRSFLRYNGNDIIISNITTESVNRWQQSIAHLTSNTRRHYLRSLSYVLKQAVEQGIIAVNPCARVKVKHEQQPRQFLLVPEIKRLLELDSEPILNAFLFGCFSGLRLGDIVALRWADIENGYIYYKQKKTSSVERMMLTENAMEILARQNMNTTLVFPMMARKAMTKHLRSAMQEAGITKHITFHCSRHTFATWLLSSDVPLNTIKEFLGHANISTTQIYAKLIDKKKDEAILTLKKL